MDWIDLQMFMRALEGVHSGQVKVTISPAGISSNGGVAVVASHMMPVPDSKVYQSKVEVEARFPSVYGKGMIETVYDLLWRLDFKISEHYKQHSLMDG